MLSTKIVTDIVTCERGSCFHIDSCPFGASVRCLYDLMDSAYDAAEIRAYSESLGHVPIIDRNPRRDAALKQHLNQEAQVWGELGMVAPEQQRYRERSTVERVNG